MNLGFYIDSPSSPQSEDVYNKLNEWVTTNQIDNGSIFYNNIGFNPIEPKFGLFNSTDLWQFTGKLVILSYSAAFAIQNIINKFKPVFLYTKQEEKNIMQIIDISNKIPLVVSNEEDFKFIKRISGKEPKVIDLSNLQEIKEVFNE